MIYLASPYSHPDPRVRVRRFRAACRAAAALLRAGHAVFSPIVYSHPLVRHGLPTHWRFWKAFDRKQIERCDEVAVLTIEGWRTSTGVQAEIGMAIRLGKPVWYLAPVHDSPRLGPVALGAQVAQEDALGGEGPPRAAVGDVVAKKKTPA
jgi:nucleoside 2-deoxyribosyltransferase